MTQPRACAKYFFHGNYAKVLESADVDNCEDQSFVVGALAFLGRIEDAILNHDNHCAQFSPEHLAANHFHLAMGQVRAGNYASARNYLAANLRLARVHSNALIDFYTAQGIGFYRFFAGRFSLARNYAEQAHRAALRLRAPYFEVFSLDLMGHALVMTGHIKSGLKHLEKAYDKAKTASLQGALDALILAMGVYKARFGLNPDSDIAWLEEMCLQISPDNNYSRGNAYLEWARQLVLRGQVSKSLRCLEDIGPHIKQGAHHRLLSLWHIRLAEVKRRQGSAQEALALLEQAKVTLQPDVDLALTLQILGHEYNIRRGLDEDCEALRERLQTLTQRSGDYFALRILARQTGAHLPSNKEDPLSCFLDGLAALSGERKEVGQKLLRLCDAGFVGLVQSAMGIRTEPRMLLLDVTKSGLLVFNDGDVFYQATGVTPTMRKICSGLSQGPLSKAQLIEQVWRYKYDAFRHDPLIYAVMNRLRHLLNPYHHWLQAHDGTYSFADDVHVALFNHAEKTERSGPSLNKRQLQILHYIEQNGTLDLKRAAHLFEASAVTLSRDFSLLTKHTMIGREGKGRATVYTRV